MKDPVFNFEILAGQQRARISFAVTPPILKKRPILVKESPP